MGGAYGTPCNGELQFWAVMQSQMREQTRQLTRIADLLAARNQAENIAFAPVAAPAAPAVDCAKLRKALDELVANLEMRASAFDVFSLVDRKVFLDAKAALAATAAELGSAAKTGAADKKPTAFKVGDKVSWTDPNTGEKTDGWTVLDAPEIPAEGPSGGEVYRIENDSGFEEEAYACELSYPEGGAR